MINSNTANQVAVQLVQYVVVRSDLLSKLKWPVGAVIAQACHAVSAVNHIYSSDEATSAYLQDLDNMHKCVLEVPDEDTLAKLQQTLEDNSVLHKVWIEQPENIKTCIAVKPYNKKEVSKYFRKYKLFNG